MAWLKYKLMELQTEGIHTVSGTHQDIRFDVRKDGGLVNVRHKDDLKKLLDSGRYSIALEHPDHGGVTYDEQGWEASKHVHSLSTPPHAASVVHIAKPAPVRGRPRGR